MRLAQGLKASLESAVARYNPHVDLAAAYLEGRRIDLEYARQCGLGVVSEEDELTRLDSRLLGRLVIPYITPAGPRQMSFRCMQDHDCKRGCAKYLPFPGMSVRGEDKGSKRLYFVMAYQTAGTAICLTEGEIDALTLNMVGIPAMGVPGAQNWQDHWSAVFEDFSSILVFRDGDVPSAKEIEDAQASGRKPEAASDKFVKKVVHELGGKVRVIRLPVGEDVNSVYVKQGYEGLISYMRK